MYEAKRQKFIEEDALIRLQLRLQEQKLKGRNRRQSGAVLFADQAARDQKASRKTMAYKVSPKHAGTAHDKAGINAHSSITLH